MKKAYTITPERYEDNKKVIDKIKYKYDYPQDKGWKYLDGTTAEERIPESVKNKYKKTAEENKAFEVPKNKIFLSNADIYNLYLNRDTDEPITARELYNIVTAIFGEIEDAENRASYEWDGQSTIM
jgi:hypothetical protein